MRVFLRVNTARTGPGRPGRIRENYFSLKSGRPYYFSGDPGHRKIGSSCMSGKGCHEGDRGKGQYENCTGYPYRMKREIHAGFRHRFIWATGLETTAMNHRDREYFPRFFSGTRVPAVLFFIFGGRGL